MSAIVYGGIAVIRQMTANDRCGSKRDAPRAQAKAPSWARRARASALTTAATEEQAAGFLHVGAGTRSPMVSTHGPAPSGPARTQLATWLGKYYPPMGTGKEAKWRKVLGIFAKRISL